MARASRTYGATGLSCATGASTPTAASRAVTSTATRGPKRPDRPDAGRARLSASGRVGAARGDLDRLAAQHDGLARQVRPDSLGVRRDRAPPRSGRARPDARRLEGARGAAAAAPP